MLATSNGVPVEFYVHAGSEAVITGLRAMALDLPEGRIRYTDAAYTDYALEDLFAEATGGQQQTARKGNSKRPYSPAQRFLIQHFSQRHRNCLQPTYRPLSQTYSRRDGSQLRAQTRPLHFCVHTRPKRLLVRNLG